jgi:hypothetical protein
MKIFKTKKNEIREAGNKFIRKNFVNFSYLQIQFRDGKTRLRRMRHLAYMRWNFGSENQGNRSMGKSR